MIDRTCTVDGCERLILVKSRGWCAMHYHRWWKRGELGGAEPLKRGSRVCKIRACDNQAVTATDLCPSHKNSTRIHRNSDGTWSLRAPCLRCGEVAVKRKRRMDLCREHYIEWAKSEVLRGRWSVVIPRDGYDIALIETALQIPVHRIVMESVLGRPLRRDESVHHMNGVRNDNRPENLELWVKPQLAGQRVEDLVAWVVKTYPECVEAVMNDRHQLRLIG